MKTPKPHIKAKKFYSIMLADESAAIGSGNRIIFIHSIGRKFVKIRSLGGLHGAAIARPIWDKALARSTRPAQVKPALVKRILRNRRRAGYKIPKTAKELLQYDPTMVDKNNPKR